MLLSSFLLLPCRQYWWGRLIAADLGHCTDGSGLFLAPDPDHRSDCSILLLWHLQERKRRYCFHINLYGVLNLSYKQLKWASLSTFSKDEFHHSEMLQQPGRWLSSHRQWTRANRETNRQLTGMWTGMATLKNGIEVLQRLKTELLVIQLSHCGMNIQRKWNTCFRHTYAFPCLLQRSSW